MTDAQLSAPSHAHDSSRRVGKRLAVLSWLSLAVLAMMLMVTGGLLVHLIERRHTDSTLINVSGRQRMLSQRIAAMAILYTSKESTQRTRDRDELAEATVLMERSHAFLLSESDNGGTSDALHHHYFQKEDPLDPAVREFIAHARALADAPPEESTRLLDAIARASRTPLLRDLDVAVSLYERESIAHMRELERWVFLLLGLILLTLTLFGAFVIRPMIARIVDHIEHDRERLDAALDSADDALFVFALGSGALVYRNDALTRLIGSRSSLRESVLEPLHDVARTHLDTHETWHDELELTTHGDERVFEVTFSRLPAHDHAPDEALGVLRDVSERRDIERKMWQNQKFESLGTLAGGIAHDFNNLLAAILGFTSLLGERLAQDPEASEDLEQIELAALRARELVSQILTYSRRVDLRHELVLADTIVSECARLLRGAAPKSVRIVTTLGAEDALVRVDPTRLHQVVMNLATNALQAYGDHPTGSIWLTTAIVEDHVELSVRDEAGGIPHEVAERIFEPFFTTKPSGTGMGLAVAHGIVEQMGGAIDVETEERLGTTFLVRLPHVTGPSHEPADPCDGPVHAPRPRAGSGRVVVVDDEPQLLNIIERTLTPLGYEVDVFTRPHEALEHLEHTGPPLLLITDYDMPTMTGCELIELAHEHHSDLPALLVTGFPGALPDTNTTPTLPKPFAAEDLLEHVHRLTTLTSSVSSSLETPDILASH